MEIKTIQKFQAADGTEFNTKEEAIAHNLAGPRIAAVEKAIEDGKLNLDAFSEIGTDTGAQLEVITIEELPAFLAANADLLLELLAKPVTKRPRKPKTEGEGAAA